MRKTVPEVVTTGSQEPQPPPRVPAVRLGVLRLDKDYPAVLGNIDNPKSFKYNVVYHVVTGLTVEMCQSGQLTSEVREELRKAIKFLIGRGVHCISGDCACMLSLQKAIRENTHRNHAVCMSPLAQLPALRCAIGAEEQIAIVTADSEALEPMKPLIQEQCGVDIGEQRYVVVGCQNVPGLEAVSEGRRADVASATPKIVELARETIKKFPKVRAFLFECAELPPYSDAVRAATGLPVYDAITTCNAVMLGFRDSGLSGAVGWRTRFNGADHEYIFSENPTQ